MGKFRTFSILGDSDSTFAGFIPEDYETYYPRPGSVPDVLCVEDTWWHLLIQRNNLHLLQNDAYSGSTVCTLVRPEHPASASFVERAKQCFRAVSVGAEQPQYIIVFGGTNDDWLERPIGNVQYSDWTEMDLESVLPAYCYVLDCIKKENPQTEILCVLNTGFAPELHTGMVCAGAHYGATVVELVGIDKSGGHPTKLGMRQIADQIQAAIERKEKIKEQ